MDVLAVEIVEDRTTASRCDLGFLTLRRLVVRNRYTDGSSSAPYPCDVLRRPGSDAVVAVLYRIREGRVEVLLREALRVPIYLRRSETFVHPDPREYNSIIEVVAGMVERGDAPGPAGLRRRAAVEALEEAGCAVPEAAFAVLGGETFASPGTGDEKIFFCAAETELEARSAADGDGSVMEEWGRLHVMELGEALDACRSGAIPDMKTEVALLRLADHIGWIPALGAFLDDLPEEVRALRRAPRALPTALPTGAAPQPEPRPPGGHARGDQAPGGPSSGPPLP
ncbi:MAG: NUDIX hydrolase [Planctomycetota bacterium]